MQYVHTYVMMIRTCMYTHVHYVYLVCPDNGTKSMYIRNVYLVCDGEGAEVGHEAAKQVEEGAHPALTGHREGEHHSDLWPHPLLK